MQIKVSKLCLIAVLSLSFFQKAISQIVLPIASSPDDVEESADGSIYVNSTNLELVNDGGDQTVGLRFNGLYIPQGAEISNAWLQFTADETSYGACSLLIRAQAADDAPLFKKLKYDLSLRQLTSNFISWQPDNWTIVGEAGLSQRSPNLAAVLQEVVDRPGWQAGNSVAFAITGTGRRTAVAFDGSAADAPRLVVEVNFPPPVQLLQNIFINELMPSNGWVKDEFGEEEDWVEIFNGSDEMISLEGLYLTDNSNNLKKWRITAPALIPPGGFGLLWLDEQLWQGGNHAPFKLSSEGEFLALSQEFNGQIYPLDALDFPATPLNISWGRLKDGQNEWTHFGEVSPGASNNGRDRYLNSAVKFSEPGGFYTKAVLLQLTTEESDADIYYTLDGSSPTLSSTIYTQPLTIAGHALVRAGVFKSGFSGSLISTENYFINPLHTLPVVSVQTEPENLWDDETGIYVIGTNGVDGYCSDQPRNWNQDWERPANITFFEPDGERAFQVNAGIKIGGGCSRGNKMKSLNVYLRNKTYGDKIIDYQVFSKLDIHQFRRLKLRNGGNDWVQMLFRDGVNQSILFNTVDLDLMAYRPVVVYLNGEYWGIHGLREMYNADYLAAHHGVDPDKVDIITNPQTNYPEIKEGDYQAFQKIRTHIENSDLSQTANYEFLLPLMDMSEYINYHIVQIYLGNSDWPANNVRVWRDRNGGPFRWMLFDLDGTANFDLWSNSLADANSLAFATATDGPSWPNNPESTLFLRKLLKNRQFRNEFVQRTASYRKLIFSPERINPIIDSLQQMVKPEMFRHINRWKNVSSDWGWGLSCGGSIGAWLGYVNSYKQFFADRERVILQHYNTTLELNGTYRLAFGNPPGTPGNLYLHNNEVKVPNNFSGDYFRNIPLRVKAVAHPGYRFIRWLETGLANPEIEFIAGQDTTLTPVFAPLAPVLTEIYYHPAGNEADEFLEFYNASGLELAVGGYRFAQGVEFEFPAGTTLQPDDYLLVVRDRNRHDKLSCQVFEWTSGDLDDNGETIELFDDQGFTVQKVSYSSSPPWPLMSGKNGASLTLKSPYSDNNNPLNWEASAFPGSSPCGIESPFGNEDKPKSFLNVYPNPARDFLRLEYATLQNGGIAVEVFNSLGQIVEDLHLPLTPFFQQEVIPIADWPKGLYFLKIKGERGSGIKFVKN